MEYAVGEFEKLQLNVPPSASALLPVSETSTGTAPAGKLERMTLDCAIEEVPAALVAVANALK